ncbi:MAG: 50S ribosome-binding GTPase [Candidatus Fermentibacteraceae bacterium]|nr:50S ribosome-binding GTPase [Candidatus Fermentibacteraceae bacterium]
MIELEKPMRSGYVAVVGLSNSGKSALVNALTARSICPSHEYSGITRIPMTSIHMTDEVQICVIDTPPLEEGEGCLQMGEVDAFCLVINSSELSGQLQSPYVMEFIAENGRKPIVIAPAFIDHFPANLHGALRNQVSMSLIHNDIVPVCPPSGQGVTTLLAAISMLVPRRGRLFPDGCISLHSERFLVSEQIRYSLFCALPPDIASTTAVQIEEFSIRDDKRYVRTNLFVARHSSKGVVIGKKGSMLQHIARLASESASRIIERQLNLDLWVKVREAWPENRNDLVEFGYIC